MNNNDLIRREDAQELLEVALEDEWEIPYAIDRLNEIPAVERSMSAVEFIDAIVAIRNHVRYCKDCPLDKRMRNCFICECIPDIVLSPDELVSDIQKWAQEHPKEVNNEID